MEAEICHSISDINPVTWDRLSAGKPFQSHRWYQFGEKVMTNTHPAYVILSENGQSVAGVSFWRVGDEPLVGAIAVFLKRWPLLICRSPLSNLAGLLMPNSQRDDVLGEIVRIGRQLRREERCSLLLFDSLNKTVARTIPRSITYSFGTQGTVLSVCADSFDQYVANLPRKERSDIRRDLRKIEDQGIVVTRHQQVEDPASAERLIRLVEQRKGSARNRWLNAMLQNLGMVNGTWLAVHIEGQLVGCAGMFEDRGAQLATAVGFDNRIPYVYFALLYETIRVGLEHGLHTLYWGTGAYAVKKRLGFSELENDTVAITF